MKKLVFLIPLFVAAIVQAQAPPPGPAPVRPRMARSPGTGTPQYYNVRCPECLTKQTLKADWVGTSGGWACTTNINGVEVQGSIQSQTAQFHCPECHYDFSAPVKPDKFVPMYPATPVMIGGPLVVETEAAPPPAPPQPQAAPQTPVPPQPPAPPSFGPPSAPVAPTTPVAMSQQGTEVKLSDGSVMVISPATLPNEVILRTIQLADGSMLNIYLRPKK